MALALAILLAAAQEVAPVVVTAQPSAPPPAEATVVIGADEDAIRSHKIAIWPDAALRARVGGLVVLTCRVSVNGLAETCRVAYEQPQGRGFGQAALALRPTVKIAPRQGPDGPVPADMNVAIRFQPPNVQSKLQDLLTSNAAIPLDPTGAPAKNSRGEANLRELRQTGQPLAMRRITMLSGPAWAAAPGFDELARAYPAEAAGVAGYAVAHCRVESTGVLSRCKAVAEEPAGRGFGKAAVALTPSFRLAPDVLAQAPKGAPVEVDVPVRFIPPTARGDRAVRAPVWLSTFEPEAMAQAFPAEAKAKGVTKGAAVLRCEVKEAGALDDCEVMLARPDGLGFDEAAMRLSRSMRMNLWSADARPVQGGVAHVAIEMDLETAN